MSASQETRRKTIGEEEGRQEKLVEREHWRMNE